VLHGKKAAVPVMRDPHILPVLPDKPGNLKKTHKLQKLGLLKTFFEKQGPPLAPPVPQRRTGHNCDRSKSMMPYFHFLVNLLR
jgi:hypothetical protein